MTAHRGSFGFVAGALGACLLLASPAQAMSKIERVVSPGGIEAWLVQERSVPLIALEFSFKGGANQDPAGKPGEFRAAALTHVVERPHHIRHRRVEALHRLFKCLSLRVGALAGDRIQRPSKLAQELSVRTIHRVPQLPVIPTLIRRRSPVVDPRRSRAGRRPGARIRMRRRRYRCRRSARCAL